MILLATVSLAVGLVVGVLAGLLGIGGGMLLVPVFKLAYAMDSLVCTATSLFTIIPTSVSGALSHIRNKTCIPKLGIAAGLGGAVTSPIGVALAAQSPDWAVMGAAALVIGYSAITMFRKALAAPKPGRTEAPASADAAALANGESLRDGYPVGRRELVIGAAVGLAAGIASGYVGVGGGFIMVPLMISLVHAPMKLVSGTSLIAVMILAVPAVIAQAVLGNINWVAGIAVACGSIPGAALGARLVPRVPERRLRFLFAGFLVVAAALLVVNQLGLWG